MSLERDPPFHSMVRASGLGEVWSHTGDSDAKFTQFGWRCTNKENSYSTGTLIGNWNEKKFDISELRKTKPLPSQVIILFLFFFYLIYSPESRSLIHN